MSVRPFYGFCKSDSIRKRGSKIGWQIHQEIVTAHLITLNISLYISRKSITEVYSYTRITENILRNLFNLFFIHWHLIRFYFILNISKKFTFRTYVWKMLDFLLLRGCMLHRIFLNLRRRRKVKIVGPSILLKRK